MSKFIYYWNIASYYKLGNDLVAIHQRKKPPAQVIFETSINEYTKRYLCNYLFAQNKKG